MNTLRSAVGLAQATDATIHVGQSTGSEAMHRVKTSEGWLGTSLAEVATHADLIITLGEGILSEAPLLAERFIKPALAEGRGEWCHIGARTPQASVAAATWSTHWPRANWYDRLTEILLQLQHLPGASPAARGLQPLLHKVREAKYIVWLWDAEEFCDAIDELTLRRLLGICRVLSETARSSLLCLDANVGRTTAQEVLLWLTGCHDTFHFDARRRHHRLPQANRTLEDWQREFERILMVRTIPSPHPLPQLSASHFLVPAESNFPIAGATQSVTLVQAIGFESDGYLMRGDRATIDLCAASGAEQPTTGLPAAADLLDRVRDRIQDESHGHVD